MGIADHRMPIGIAECCTQYASMMTTSTIKTHRSRCQFSSSRPPRDCIKGFPHGGSRTRPMSICPETIRPTSLTPELCALVATRDLAPQSGWHLQHRGLGK